MEVLRRGGERAESNGRRNESGEKEAVWMQRNAYLIGCFLLSKAVC